MSDVTTTSEGVTSNAIPSDPAQTAPATVAQGVLPQSADASVTNPLRVGMRRKRAPEPCTLVIFGVTGDLAKRKLLPAIFGLWQDGQLGTGFSVVGVGRAPMSEDEFLKMAQDALTTSKETDEIRDGNLEKFLALLSYVGGEFGDAATYAGIGARLSDIEHARGAGRNALFYLSTPPSLFEVISAGLGAAGLAREDEGWRRLIIEKPFGRDLASADALNDHIHQVWQEHQIYRIDHYLGKETVQNILAIRFGNLIFEPIWNRSYVEHVQITAAEDLGMEGRGGYYEEAGVVRDMLQNHLLQLFTYVAMEPPVAFDADAIRDEKEKVLRAVKPISAARAAEVAVRGQYGPGTLYGERVKGYREEDKVAPDSMTPTFVAVKLEVENWRWSGVPFFLRSGKRLPKKVTEIAVVFHRPPLGLFPGGTERNVLAFRIQPDEGISLKFSSKTPGQENVLREVVMDFRYDAFGAELESPYSRLLLDAMLGDATLFPREDEVEQAWKLVSGILEAWTKPDPNLPNYPAGTWGPDAADALLGPDRRWRHL